MPFLGDFDTPDSLIPPIGELPQADRLFRINWASSLERSPSGVPLQPPAYVARQGRGVRVIDLRSPAELTGPLGYIPGASWIPLELADSLETRIADRFAPIIFVSRGGERSAAVARRLELAGFRMVASLRGGMVDWKALGYGGSHDPEILSRRDVLLEIPRQRVMSEGRHLSSAQIAEHVGSETDVRWLKLAAIVLWGKCSCVDGRDDAAVIGTPGGDAGELALTLGALEEMLGKPLEPTQIEALVARAADALGSLYLHTDIQASNELIKALRQDSRLDDAIGQTYGALEWRRWLRNPPEEVREILLSHMIEPAHVGCGHLRLMMQHPAQYGIREGLASDLYSSFLRRLWTDSAHFDFTVLGGRHQEGAVVNVRVEGELHSYTQIPLISPSCAGSQMFVNHPQVSAHMRRELASLVCEQGDTIRVSPSKTEELVERVNVLGERQLHRTLGHLAAGLPVYEIEFDRRRYAKIHAIGAVPT